MKILRKLASYFKAVLKFLLLTYLLNKVKSMIWRKTKKQTKQKIKEKTREPVKVE